MSDEIVQYYVVNSELDMSAGKIAAQVAHVATLIANKYSGEVDKDSPYQYETFENWLRYHNQKKIILRGKEKDLLNLIAKHSSVFHIRDNGLTEIPKDSLTVVGFPPEWKSIILPYVKRLQLL